MKEILEGLVKVGFTPEQAGIIYWCSREILYKEELINPSASSRIAALEEQVRALKAFLNF